VLTVWRHHLPATMVGKLSCIQIEKKGKRDLKSSTQKNKKE
jgi:hypothetical protein